VEATLTRENGSRPEHPSLRTSRALVGGLATVEPYIVTALLALTFLRLPGPTATDLDPSWGMVLSHAFANGWQSGRDIIFTYGPLGGPTCLPFAGSGFWLTASWGVFSSIFCSLVFVAFACSLPWWRRLVLYALAAITALAIDHQGGFALLVLASWLIPDGESRPADTVVRLGGAFLMGVFTNIKFTHFLYSSVAVALVALCLVRQRRSRTAGSTISMFVAGALFAWVVCGQSLLNLPTYLASSSAIASGYSAMATSESSLIFKLGVSTFASLMFLIVSAWAVSDRTVSGLACGLLMALELFLIWKHGFVRGGDNHVLSFFGSAAIIATAIPGFIGFRRMPALLGVVALLPAMLGAYGFVTAEPRFSPSGLPALLGQRLLARASALTSLLSADDAARQGFAAVQRREALPEVRRYIGKRTVDVIGFEQGVAIVNALNYAPRPVFQGYAAYSPRLVQANREYFAGERSPEFALAKVQTIDGRYPSLDDAPVWLALLQRYTPVLKEHGYTLWEKQPNRAAPAIEPVGEQSIRFGQWLNLRPWQGRVLWVEVLLTPSPLGRAIELLYKVPHLFIVTRDERGADSRFRLIAGMASEGFMISPRMNTAEDWSVLSRSGPKSLTGVNAFMLTFDSVTDARFFAKRLTVRIYEVPQSWRTPSTLSKISG
jgi:hypothetical protein